MAIDFKKKLEEQRKKRSIPKAKKDPAKFQLTPSQQKVFNTAEGDFNNILITGKPGVGKSVLINHLTTQGAKYYHIAAPTGLAALNVNGKTLHSLFALPSSEGAIHEDYNNFTNNDKVISKIRGMKHLIIDEISMVRADMFDFLDRCMRTLRNAPLLPFGGVQMILVGDFFQLPPVARSEEKKQLKELGYESPFAFSSRVFQEGNFKVLELSEVLRQKGDKDFIDILHAARTGSVTPKQVAKLNSRVHPGVDDIRIRLTAINKQADAINQSFLAALPDKEWKFDARIFGYWPAYPCEQFLGLKIGAQVMVKKNRADIPPTSMRHDDISLVVNGTLGIVHRFVVDDPTKTPCIEIALEDGNIVPIYRQTWERKEKQRGLDGWTEEVIATYSQYPLALAWAISMHKSQGQSFEKVHIDLSRTFEAGQAYVALSRCKSMAGITLEQPINTRLIYADIKVIKFYEKFE